MSFGQRQQAWASGSGGNPQLNAGLFPNQLTGLVNAAQPFANLSSLAPGLNALVNQAAFSNMNQVLAQAQRAQQMLPQATAPQRQASPPPSAAGRTQRNFIGTVTKLMETYGFVDEDVFFQTSVIRGTLPRVGDRVVVEASYNPSMPFKWNAYSLRLMQQESPQQNLIQAQQQSAYHSRSTSSAVGNTASGGGSGGGSRWTSSGDRHRSETTTTSSSDRHRQSSRRSPPSVRRASPPSRSQRSPPPASRRSRTPERSRRSPIPLKRERDQRSRERSPIVRDRERDRSPARRESRNRSPSVVAVSQQQIAARRDSLSPPRRRQRIIPRYQCSVPKPLIGSAEMKYSDVHKRYPQMYVPSDFIRCEMSWLKSLPTEEPITFSPHSITFHVMHKDVDFPLAVEAGAEIAEGGAATPVENPPDADSRHIVKVLLLSHQGATAIRQKVFGLLPDGSIDENVETQSLFKNLFFLHGLRGRSESMGIGGAWSPSLDGDSPSDPQTLIKTAVRTTLASTGVDLSACSKWYKIAQLSYYRAERGRVHTVTLMLPDLSASSLSLMPSAEAYVQTEERVKAQLAAKLAAIDAEEFVPPPPRNAATVAAPTVPASTNNESSEQQIAALPSSGDGDAAGADVATAPSQPQTVAANSEQPTAPLESAPKPKGKTHWSQLNIKAMKVAELREELEVRGIDSKGVKNALVQRLQEAVDKEKAEEEANPSAALEEPKDDSAPAAADKEIKEERMDTDELEIVGEVKNATIPPAEEELVERKDEEMVAVETAPKKTEKELKELERAKEKFERERKERKAALERHYTMPKEPCVLVFPSKTAKGGKFECRVSSLAALLDYRPDDNKESSFEVFLFTEAFKEALDRSHAFAVFKAIATALDKDEERKRRDAALVETPVVKENGVEESTPGKDESVEATKTAEGGGAAAGGEEKKPSGKEKDEKKKDVDLRTLYKSLVSHVELFSSFAYFDQNVCGHIDERDFEEILYSLRLDISRTDVQRLAKKLSSRDRINYRNLTDKWVDKEGNVKYCHPEHDATQSPVDPAFAHYELLASSGNGCNVAGQAVLGQTPDVTETGVVFYRGTVLNITHTMEQQKAMEQERDASLLKSQELQFTLKSTKEQRDYLEKKRRRLEEDVERYKKKLHDAEKSLKTSQDNAGEMKIALQSCKRFGERLVEVVDKIMPPPKKEKSEKAKKEEKTEAKVATTTTPGATGGADETAPSEDAQQSEETAGDVAVSQDAVMEGEFVLAEEVGEGAEEAEKAPEELAEDGQGHVAE